MAVNTEKTYVALKLQLDKGTDDSGKQLLQSKTFSGVRTEATDENIYAAAELLGGLHNKDLKVVKKVEEIKITKA